MPGLVAYSKTVLIASLDERPLAKSRRSLFYYDDLDAYSNSLDASLYQILPTDSTDSEKQKHRIHSPPLSKVPNSPLLSPVFAHLVIGTQRRERSPPGRGPCRLQASLLGGQVSISGCARRSQ